jgi:hypothetical protein
MGISLNGLTPAGTYPGLIKTGDNTAISGTPKVLSDGNGNDLPMEVSTTGVNFTNQLQQGGVAVPTAGQVAAKQDTLVSGTNIKTINGTSLLGSGNIPVVTSPSGVSGAIQFSNGSAFASDAANFFWDNTNKRLGIGTNAPNTPVGIDYSGNGDYEGNKGVSFGGTTFRVGRYFNIGILNCSAGPIFATAQSGFQVGVDYGAANGVSAGMLGVRGKGSTSATTSFLVQNSAGNPALQVDDDRGITLAGSPASGFVINATGTNAAARFGACAIGTWGVGGIFSLGSTNSTATRIATNNIAALYLDTNQSVNVGVVAAVASAQLQVDSTTKGLLPPRMTTTQKNAIASPAAGLVVYDSTTNKLQCYNGSTWNDLF